MVSGHEIISYRAAENTNDTPQSPVRRKLVAVFYLKCGNPTYRSNTSFIIFFHFFLKIVKQRIAALFHRSFVPIKHLVVFLIVCDAGWQSTEELRSRPKRHHSTPQLREEKRRHDVKTATSLWKRTYEQHAQTQAENRVAQHFNEHIRRKFCALEKGFLSRIQSTDWNITKQIRMRRFAFGDSLRFWVIFKCLSLFFSM